MTRFWLIVVAAAASACLLEQRPCEGGGVRVDGLCACPDGTTQIGHTCVKTCEAGFVAQGRECQPVVTPCPAGEEECQSVTDCASGELWDEELASCRKPTSCAQLECEAPRSCQEGDAQHDARCGCAAGEGWDEQGEACPVCAGEPPACDDAGESGAVLFAGDARCVCETLEGYFLPADEGTAAACDGDDDGWLDERAQAVLEGSDELLRRNARCTLRRIRAFVLRNEAGREYSVDLSGGFPNGLPLYESARNDGAAGAGAIPDYGSGGRAFEPRELNSLTKGCSSASADFNDNGVPDVREWSKSQPEPERFAGNTRLQRYYAAYTASAYFLELHDGYYEAPAGSSSLGAYRAVERSRRVDANSRVAMQDSTDGTFGRACARHPDALYSAASPNTIGGDYAQYGDFADMTHHSQYKCVQVLSEFSYGPEPLEQEQPQLVYRRGGQLARRNATGERLYNWTINDCRASGSSVLGAPEDTPKNPSFASITCEPNAAPAFDTVHWVAVGYEHYVVPYVDVAERGGYQRGCINECIEQLYASPRAADCTACTTDAATGAGKLHADPNDRPTDDGNDCTHELCEGREPIRPDKDAGAACGSGGVCNGGGVCGVCVPDQTRCTPGGDSVQSCGADGQWGPGTPCAGDGVVCVAGACQPCAAGLRDCDEQSSNLCEQDIASHPAHCGGCMLACSGTGITPHCTMGVCDGACTPDPAWGFHLDCNNDKRSDGCEITSTFESCIPCTDCSASLPPEYYTCQSDWCTSASIPGI
jgi:hypothetical protein